MRAINGILILVALCLVGCTEDEPPEPSSARHIDPSAARYADVRQLDELTKQACKCKTAGCAAKVRAMAAAFVSESARATLPGNEAFEICLRAASGGGADPKSLTPEAFLKDLKSAADKLCACKDLACVEALEKLIQAENSKYQHLRRKDFPEPIWEEIQDNGNRAKKCREALEP